MPVDPLVDELVDELGTQVSELLGEGPNATQLQAQRHRWLNSAPPPRRPRGVRPLMPWAVMATAGAAVLVLWLRDPGGGTDGVQPGVVEPPVIAQVRPFVVGEALSGEYRVDGGHVQASTHARAEVAQLSEKETRLELDEGELRLALAEGSGVDRRWTVAAGAARVEASAGDFSLQVDPDKGLLRVDVWRGEVRVFAQRLGPAGQSLRPGASLVVEIDEPLVIAQPEPPQSADAEGLARSEEKKPRYSPSAPPASWKDLADGGDYKRALAKAERVGFDRLLSGLKAADLKLLADTARLARDGDKAERALKSLRKRFPRRREGRMAAFLLGRVAVDLGHDHRAAARWFQIYVDENPRGAFVGEARGRLMEALVRSGDRSAAKSVAREYLDGHPAGPYHQLARSLTGASAPANAGG